jgi:hypothetical protein
MAEGIGTTLVAATLHEHALYFVSVGDSGLFVASGGDVRMVNHPHVFANVLDAAVARGTLSREDALAHPERESLTSFIGVESLEEIDRNLDPFPLLEGDTVLLASDGMFKTLPQEEIGACLGGDPQTWPEILVERTLAKKREFQDNVTVLSVTLTKDVAALPRTVVRRAPEIPPAPPAPDSLPLAAVEWSPPVESKASNPKSSGAVWRSVLGIAILILFLAAAAAGWWYARRVSAQGAPVVPAKPVSDPTSNPGAGPTIPASQIQPGDTKGPQQ